MHKARMVPLTLRSTTTFSGSNSTPIFGSLRSRPTHWLTRKLDPVRFRELPLESTTEQLISAAASAEDDLEGNHGLRAPKCGQKPAESGENGQVQVLCPLHLSVLSDAWCNKFRWRKHGPRQRERKWRSQHRSPKCVQQEADCNQSSSQDKGQGSAKYRKIL